MNIIFDKTEHMIKVRFEKLIGKEVFPFRWTKDLDNKFSIIFSVRSSEENFQEARTFLCNTVKKIGERSVHIEGDTFNPAMKVPLPKNSDGIYGQEAFDIIFNKNNYIKDVTEMRIYAWDISKNKNGYSKCLGDWISHQYVEKHTVEEIKNTPIKKVAEMLFDNVEKDERKAKYYGHTYHMIQNRCIKLVNGKENLLKQYEHFIRRKLNKHMLKYHNTDISSIL